MDGVWVAVAGGAGALVGGIGAQFVNGTYSRRRAERDLTHNRWGHWRDERLSAYLELFSAVESWLKILYAYEAQEELKKSLGGKIEDDCKFRVNFDKFLRFNSVASRYGDEVSRHYVKIQCLGSKEFVKRAEILDAFLRSNIEWHRIGSMGGSYTAWHGDTNWGEIFKQRDSFEGETRRRLNLLIDAARRDLGSDIEIRRKRILVRIVLHVLGIPSWFKKSFQEIKEEIKRGRD
ncbi:hypothetical protein G3I59_17865 [Amycolatopsis rubida]|uniref:DUF4760 domain-containing protein n=1 Tax=Amycolatopsis rubida TaxID=112413 RepID=A0ABX0BP82_9PSEU|nr:MULTISPECIES: hypothetical protein [Amycolatopsis]MYW92423.1 hypothetical protein [Amycolatopsis rubida]NEC57411.1 hypothetical protein [Amycolatopsis rubida]OAP29022.1 hypothetical protein A4R44_00816 [Amycolatopsis sp. M39]